jgi:hypothetical protein
MHRQCLSRIAVAFAACLAATPAGAMERMGANAHVGKNVVSLR